MVNFRLVYGDFQIVWRVNNIILLLSFVAYTREIFARIGSKMQMCSIKYCACTAIVRCPIIADVQIL